MRGVTLLEFVVVIAIVVVLTSIIVNSFSAFKNNKVLDTGVENILSVLAKARGNTLASKNAYQYGVHFESAQIVLFQGAVYSVSDPNNEIISLDTSLEVSSISLAGGGSEVIFDRLTGKTSENGTIVIRVKSDTTKTKTITIDATGIASAS
jgi:prepilin-type N-terminal cleavage/methylation domain-containing protein